MITSTTWSPLLHLPSEPERKEVPDSEDPPPRLENMIARSYAEQGYQKFAALIEAGHGCAACHLTRPTNAIPTDDAIDLERYQTVASVMYAARAVTELATDGFAGAASVMQVRLGSQVAKIRVVHTTKSLDLITARQIGTEIATNPVASRAYRQIQNAGAEVLLDFQAVPPGLMGKTRLYANEIEVYVNTHRSVRETVSTIVHESSHIQRFARGNRASQLDEVRAFSREFLYFRGRRPRAHERRAIWRSVERLYPDLKRKD